MAEQASLLQRQTALVTGASSGIGKAIAIAMALAGARVAVNYHRGGEKANQVVKAIESAGGVAIALQADVSREEEVTQMFQTVCDTFGTLDILVNNAGIQQDAALVDMSLEQWNQVLQTNLTGQFLCAREAAREFIRRGVQPEISQAAGKIICISSVHEVIPWACRVNYAASKGGVMQLMKSMAQELAPYRIRINSIAPGAIKTEINRSAWETPTAEQELLKYIPYGRVGDPEDIARAAVWLASDQSDYIHGHTLFIDGGMLLYPFFAEGG